MSDYRFKDFYSEPTATKPCKYCTRQIPEQAKVCPYCNRKQSHKGRNITLIIIGVIVLLFILGSCMAAFSGPSTETNSSTATTDEATENDNSTQKDSGFTIGDTAEVDDVKVTLLSAETTDSLTSNISGIKITPDAGKEFLVTDWEVVNDSDNDLMIGPASFEAYVDNTSVNFSYDTSMIDGALQSDFSLSPGRETGGKIVYEVPENWQICEIEAKPTLFGDTVTFAFTKGE